MSYEHLLIEKNDGVGVITLNRPDRLNAFTTNMFHDLPEALTGMAIDPLVRVLILTGSGRAFCAGADLAEGIIAKSTDETAGRGQAANLAAYMRELQTLIYIIRRMGKPVIGAINGDAVGAGFSLALACDMRIVSAKARFGMVFSRIGLVPDLGGAYFLTHMVGTAKACELIMTGDVFDAAEAYRLGLVNKIVPPEELMSAALELAHKLAEGAPIATALAKDMIYKEANMDIAEALDYEATMQAMAMQTADHLEGVKAFKEKRKPVFQGS
ncbi:MAG: enoyl-CoA hydratase [Dehalococcoidia bacterium]|nr:enoyl-CoA hydratase [Dehalococcoidia bacterium]